MKTKVSILFSAAVLTAAGTGDARVSSLTKNGDWDLFLMRPDGSEQRNISNSKDFNEMGGRFSPDGKKLSYRRIPKDSKINHDVWGAMGELIIANYDGSGAADYGKAG